MLHILSNDLSLLASIKDVNKLKFRHQLNKPSTLSFEVEDLPINREAIKLSNIVYYKATKTIKNMTESHLFTVPIVAWITSYTTKVETGSIQVSAMTIEHLLEYNVSRLDLPLGLATPLDVDRVDLDIADDSVRKNYLDQFMESVVAKVRGSVNAKISYNVYPPARTDNYITWRKHSPLQFLQWLDRAQPYSISVDIGYQSMTLTLAPPNMYYDGGVWKERRPVTIFSEFNKFTKTVRTESCATATDAAIVYAYDSELERYFTATYNCDYDSFDPDLNIRSIFVDTISKEEEETEEEYIARVQSELSEEAKNLIAKRTDKIEATCDVTEAYLGDSYHIVCPSLDINKELYCIEIEYMFSEDNSFVQICTFSEARQTQRLLNTDDSLK